ncbi:TPA: FMN-binding protein [bacterium]|nr:FMN-binding protein [bacterium]
MNQKSLKYKIWTVVFLIIVVCGSTAMLSTIYANTKTDIEQNELTKLKQNILNVFDIPYDQSNIESVFNENITIEKINGIDIYRASEGLAFEINGSGFWDKISVLLALEYDMETIKGIKVLKNNETPGLGSRITEEWFLGQFKGKNVKPEIKIISQKKLPHQTIDTTTSATYDKRKKNEVDAITGATQTSKSLEKLINNGVKMFYQKTSLENNG